VGWERLPGIACRLLAWGALLGFGGQAAVSALLWAALPAPLFRPVYSTVVFDRDGRLLSASIAPDGQWRFPADGEVPEKFAQALVAWEDKRFYRHPGVDLLAIGRALLQNARAGEVRSGASTLSMQVIRLARGNRPRSVGEKLIEMVLAFRLELGLRKPEILRAFASHAPFGGNVVGFEAAAWRYFGREPRALSWSESAMLAVLPNNPALVHPGRNRQVLLAKRNRLLEILRSRGVLDRESCGLALAEPLPAEPLPLPRHAPHLLARARQESASAGGVRVRTTLDFSLQLRVNDILQRRAADWQQKGIGNGAILVLEVDSGNVLAYSGNVPLPEQPQEGSYVDLISSPRSTGSLLKPFLYAAAMEAGELLPDQLLPDIPTRMGSFIPENNSRTYQGAVPAGKALAHSLNIPAVRLLRGYGLQRFYDLLRELGLSSLFRPAAEYGLTLVLGGAEGSLWELTGLFAGLARSAKGVAAPFFPPRYLPPLPPTAGPKMETRSLLGAGACWLTLRALLEVERPEEEGAWRDYLGSKRIAWKTGTSYGFRDAWAIGVTPRYAVGVWVGNASGEGQAELKGSTVAAPVLFDVFGLLPDSAWFAAPQRELEVVTVCARSGQLAGPNCADTTPALATAAGAKAAGCRYCRIVHLDGSGRFLASTQTQAMGELQAVRWFVLPPAMEWYYQHSHADYRRLPPWRAGEAQAGPARTNLSLVFPEPGGRIYIPIDLDGERGRTIFRAAHRDPRTTVFWHLDGVYLGETTELHDMEARPGPGLHRLTLVDEYGEECALEFFCLSQP
jgi:penicillin-binding protein 1C